MKKIKKCRSCKTDKIQDLFNLGDFYLQGSFLKKGAPQSLNKKYKLFLVLCSNCSLVQLKHTVNKEILYKNYWYLSGVNLTMKNHLKLLVKKIIKTNSINKRTQTNILDIGCNDGTLIRNYPNSFFKIGIDPSNVVKKIRKNYRTKIVNDFFPPKKKLLPRKKFDIITAIAMFYDTNDPIEFSRYVKKILSPNGFWVIELSYLMDMIKLNSFDTICNEHLEYYSLSSLKFIMKKSDLKIFKIEFNKINGGSIRCYVTHENNEIYDNNVYQNKIKKVLHYESIKGVKSKTVYLNFYKKIIILKKKIKLKISSILKKNKIIHGYGASTKGNTILQWLGIDYKKIRYIADRNKLKWGATTIGTNIEIISEHLSRKMKPDYYFVLPWHFKQEFLKRERSFLRKGGKLIFPLPNLKIL
jgi:hypothetical protein